MPKQKQKYINWQISIVKRFAGKSPIRCSNAVSEIEKIAQSLKFSERDAVMEKLTKALIGG